MTTAELYARVDELVNAYIGKEVVPILVMGELLYLCGELERRHGVVEHKTQTKC